MSLLFIHINYDNNKCLKRSTTSINNNKLYISTRNYNLSMTRNTEHRTIQINKVPKYTNRNLSPTDLNNNLLV